MVGAVINMNKEELVTKAKEFEGKIEREIKLAWARHNDFEGKPDIIV
jgi:hypothetical protein